MPVAVDVRAAAGNERLVDTAMSRFGRLDVLVASAGTGLYGGIIDNGDEDLVTMIDTNVTGTVWAVRRCRPCWRTVAATS